MKQKYLAATIGIVAFASILGLTVTYHMTIPGWITVERLMPEWIDSKSDLLELSDDQLQEYPEFKNMFFKIDADFEDSKIVPQFGQQMKMTNHEARQIWYILSGSGNGGGLGIFLSENMLNGKQFTIIFDEKFYSVSIYFNFEKLPTG